MPDEKSSGGTVDVANHTRSRVTSIASRDKIPLPTTGRIGREMDIQGYARACSHTFQVTLPVASDRRETRRRASHALRETRLPVESVRAYTYLPASINFTVLWNMESH